MSDVAVMKSYLVDLGFRVDQPSYRQFTSVIAHASSLIGGSVFSMSKGLLKLEAELVGVFTAMSGAIITSMDKVAMADQEYRLFGQRMFMDTQHAKSLKIALDALGQPMEAVAFDPELHRRFVVLQEDQQKLMAGLGTGFEQTMINIRDVRFEFTRMGVELEYLLQGVVSQVAKELGLGDGSLVGILQKINTYIISHIPEWSRVIAKDLVPILKDTWVIIKDLAILFGLLANHFTNFIAVLSGDTTLQSTTFSFEKFAGAIEKCLGWVAKLLDYLIKIQQVLVPISGTLTGAATGAALGSFIPGVGTATGAIVGAGMGAVGDLIAASGNPQTAGTPMGTVGGDVAARARALAQQVGAELHVSPDIILAQWMHETGGFKNRGATSLNNLAGIKNPGGNGYKQFGSLDEFGSYYAHLLEGKRYSGVMGSKDVDSFASALKRGGYMEDSLNNYERGMKSFMPQGGNSGPQSIDNSVSIGDIHITKPNASVDEIKNAVVSAVQQKRDAQIQRQIAEFTSVYG